jgi:predicted ATP-grasp superfamily ATP-dependent carboligase
MADILIAEFVSGGGSPQASSSLLSEGFAMLRTLIQQAHSAGLTVTTTLDPRLKTLLPLLGDCHIQFPVGAEEFFSILGQEASGSRYAICVAPETDGILARCTMILSLKAERMLCCLPHTANMVSNKFETGRKLSKMGLQVPPSLLLRSAENSGYQSFCQEHGWPVILKPVVGAGGEGVFLVKDSRELEKARKRILDLQPDCKSLLLQKQIPGPAGSLSLLCFEARVVPIAINTQEFCRPSTVGTFEYEGGLTPPQSPLTMRREEFRALWGFMQLAGGFRGYVGFDFIAPQGKPIVIVECNPRMTTPFVAFPNLFPGSNFLSMAIDLSEDRGAQPPNPVGAVRFGKLLFPTRLTQSRFKTIVNDPAVVSPPIPNTKKPCAFIVAHGSTPDSAIAEYNATRSNLVSEGS